MARYCSHCGKPLIQGAGFCGHCGGRVIEAAKSETNLQGKREKVMGKQRQRKKNWVKISVIVATLALLGGWLYSNLPKGSNPTIEAQPAVLKAPTYPPMRQEMINVPSKVENGKIIVPLSAVKEKKFVAFNYVTAKKNVPLLAYISGEGKVVTAVSMCEPCNSQRFHIRGEELVCNSCGSTWELNSLRAISGACGRYPPDAIPSKVVGDEVQIEEGVVARWQRRI